MIGRWCLAGLAGVVAVAGAVGSAVPGAAGAAASPAATASPAAAGAAATSATGSVELRASDLGPGWRPASAGSPPHSFQKAASSSNFWLATSTVTAETNAKAAQAQLKGIEADLRSGGLLASLTEELDKHGRHAAVSGLPFPALGSSTFAYRESWIYVSRKASQPEVQDVISAAVGPLLVTLTTLDVGASSPVPLTVEKAALSKMVARAGALARARAGAGARAGARSRRPAG